MAGNICTQTHPLFYKFFEYCSANWEKVFFTPGNAEFHIKKKHFNLLDFEYKYKLNEKYKNVFYLNDECVALNDEIDVYGSILWTPPEFNSTEYAKMRVNDYNYITYYKQGINRVVDWDITYVKHLSAKSYNCIQNHLKKTKKQISAVR